MALNGTRIGGTQSTKTDLKLSKRECRGPNLQADCTNPPKQHEVEATPEINLGPQSTRTVNSDIGRPGNEVENVFDVQLGDIEMGPQISGLSVRTPF